MRYLKPTWPVALSPALLIAGACLPFDFFVFLRYTLYAILAWPLMPLIRKLGWVYRDKQWYLTPEATVFVSVVWALVLYFLLCFLRSHLKKPIST